MQKIILGLSFAATIFTANVSAQNSEGQRVFETKGCVVCHKKDMDTIGPSLRTIATSYASKEHTMISYLQGNSAPIVDPARASVMNPQLVKIRTLFEADMQALAEYMVSANDRPF